jgi:hypothetical protein
MAATDAHDGSMTMRMLSLTATGGAIALAAAMLVARPHDASGVDPLRAGATVDGNARIGINVTAVNYWANEPTFANQAMGVAWLDNWKQIPDDRLRPDGMPKSVEPGHTLNAILIPPAPAYTGGTTATRCTWKGTGSLSAGGELASAPFPGDHRLDFSWRAGKPPRGWLELRSSSAADPVRDLDCRLRSDAPDAVFARSLVDYLKPFGVLRFLDWSSANGNPASVTWATRGQPRGISIGGSDGIALEYQIGLANRMDASPWFTVPLNADADYQRRMAQMVHDRIPAGRPVYVELSNETWNYQFGQAHQAQKEGVAAQLSENPFQAAQYRYAQRIIGLMAIWSTVFADRPRDLVRVVATQAGNPWVGEILMDWKGGALRSSIDAIAIAPYFSIDLATGGREAGPQLDRLAAAAHSIIAKEAAAYAALAKRTGKRLIAYEGGQHLVDPERVDLVKAINRDPRMATIYADYLKEWQAVSGGDVLTLYAATGPISRYGAWGLREYAGQPMAETPKLRGAIAAGGAR